MWVFRHVILMNSIVFTMYVVLFFVQIDLNEILAQLRIQEQFSHVPGREW